MSEQGQGALRLSALRLTRYGNFEDQPITLDPAPGRLNIVCAPNGAGKSVLRTAMSDLLFGIGGKSPMGFRFNYAGMHIAAEARTQAGETIRFGRRKGHGTTLTDGDGAAADNLPLAALLGATDRSALERLFALDTERLRRGGDDLLASGGLVAEALLSAGGLTHAREARQKLNERADNLAPARRLATRPFYVATERFVAARRQAADALLKPDAWERAMRDIAAAEAALASAKQANEQAQAAMVRLQRLRRVRPILADMDAAEAWLRGHPDAPDLPQSLADRFPAALSGARAADEKLRAEAARAAALRAEHDAIATDPALLAQAGAIDILSEQAGAVIKAAEDAVRLRAAMAQLDAQTAQTLRRLGMPEDEPQPARLLPPRALEARLRKLIREHGSHDDACRKALQLQAKLQAEISAHRAATPQEADGRDLSAIIMLLDEIRTAGDPADRAQEAAARLGAARTSLAAAMAATPFWPQNQDAQTLRALAVPAAPALERSHAALARAEAECAALEKESAKAAQHLHDAAKRLQDITGGRIVPDRDAVAAARKSRQDLWNLVARTAFGTAPDAADLAYLGGQPLALAYERAVQDADAIADRRADESALIEQAREAERQRGLAAQAELAVRAALAESRTRVAALLAAWQTLLPPSLPPVCRLDDVREFCAARLRVIERLEAMENAGLAADTLETRHEKWRAALSERMQLEDGDLAALTAAAARLIASAATTEKRRAEFTSALATLQQQHKQAEFACAEADAARQAWRHDWAGALETLGQPADQSPVAIEETLRLLSELDTALADASEKRTRVADIVRDAAAFTARVQALCAALSPDAETLPDTNAALARLRQLRDAAASARKCDTQREQLRAQITQAERNLAGLAQACEQRHTDLAAILQAAGADTPDAAEARLSQSATRARHATQLADAQERLLREGDGLDAQALRAELADLSAEQAAASLAAAEQDARTAQDALAHHAADAARLKHALSVREAETSYADAVAAQNEAASMAGRALREALVARLAASLLDSAMQSVERQATPALLTRISHWFCALTNGAFTQVRTDNMESGDAALIMIPRDHAHEPKYVNQLSEGTRDQLYLALRLAAIETHKAALPFIADDILQTSDDDRAEAAMAALLELSERTQVILLTHHRHIAALARERFGAAVHEASLTH